MPDNFKEYTTYQVDGPPVPIFVAELVSFQWPGMLRTLRQMALTNGACEEGLAWHVKADGSGAIAPHRALAHVLTLRGKGLENGEAIGPLCGWLSLTFRHGSGPGGL